jgi:hypothetical protein
MTNSLLSLTYLVPLPDIAIRQQSVTAGNFDAIFNAGFVASGDHRRYCAGRQDLYDLLVDSFHFSEMRTTCVFQLTSHIDVNENFDGLTKFIADHGFRVGS